MEDTITAIATAPGEGGIGIVRISGEKSREILEQIFTRVKKEYSKQQDSFGEHSDEQRRLFFLPDALCDVSGVQIQKDIRRIIRFFILLPDVRTAAAVKLFARSRFLGISKTQLRAADV